MRMIENAKYHYDDVIMSSMASQITSLTIIYSTVYSGTDQRKHQSSASLAFVWVILGGPVWEGQWHPWAGVPTTAAPGYRWPCHGTEGEWPQDRWWPSRSRSTHPLKIINDPYNQIYHVLFLSIHPYIFRVKFWNKFYKFFYVWHGYPVDIVIY